jgi:inner membrane protein
MDNLAHALVGAALGRAVADRHVARAGLIGVVAANAPDWTEVFTGFFRWTQADYLVEHRGVTHSLAAAAVEIGALTLIIGLAARWWTRWRRRGAPPPWGWLGACVSVTLLSHLFLDWQGSYGWRPFLPWNGRWYYLDWVAIADPFFWLLPLIALAWGANRHWLPLSGTLLLGTAFTLIIVRYVAVGGPVASWMLMLYGVLCVVAAIGWVRFWFGPVARQRAAIIAVLLLGLYSGAQGVAVQFRKAQIRSAAERRFGSDARWATLTNVGQPFTWEAMYASADTIANDEWRMPRRLDDPRVTRALRETPQGRAMTIFARFLAADLDSTTVYLLDARYARGGRGWAVLPVRMD